MKRIPNNPAAAYIAGKRHGTKENMELVAMVLCDKFGFHIKQETEDESDTKSIEYLFENIVKLAEEINGGTIKKKDIADAVAEEYKAVFEG